MSDLSMNTRTFFGIEDETWMSMALWSILCYHGLLGAVNRMVNMIVSETTAIDTIIIYVLWFFFVVMGILAAMKRAQRREFALITIIGLLWFFSFLINEHARALLRAYYFRPVIIEGFCGIICIANLKSWGKFQKIGKVYVFIGMVLFLINTYFVIKNEIVEQYMAYAYNNLIFVVASFWFSLHKKSVIMWVFAALGAFALIITGCRGAILCVVVYLLLELILNKKIKKVYKMLFFVAAVVAFLNLEPIMTSIDTTLKQYGYRSRNIEMFFKGTLQEDSGRGNIAEYATKVIWERPIFGCGMAGDSYYIYKSKYGVAPISYQRSYSHNFILDIYLHFGIFLGTIIMVYFIWQLIRAYVKNRDNDIIFVLFMLFSITMPKLFFSSTYLEEPAFFILLGLIMNANNQNSDDYFENSEVAIDDV